MQRLQQQQTSPGRYGGPRMPYSPRTRYMSPQSVRPIALTRAGPGVRHEPYSVPRQRRVSLDPLRSPPMPSGIRTPTKMIKVEPGDNDDTSNQSAPEETSSPSSPSHNTSVKQDNANEDPVSESSTSTIPNEAGTEGLSLGADLSNLISDSDNQSANPSNSDNIDPNVKIEAISESEMELEITGVEPGRPVIGQDWGPDTSMVMGYDPMGATGSPGDMAAAQQGYSKCLISFLFLLTVSNLLGL